MAISYDEAMVVLSAFEESFFLSLGKQGITSLLVGEDNGQLVVEVGVDSQYKLDLKLPNSFKCSMLDNERDVQIKVVYRNQATPLSRHYSTCDVDEDDARAVAPSIRAGQRARGDGMSGVGTAGWFYYLEYEDGEVLVCMSNWHVLCARGNDSDVGVQPCLLNGRDVAVLHSLERIEASNRWDLALARVRDSHIGDILAEMEPCPGGRQFPYPSDWTAPSRVQTGAAVHKVGIGSGCSDGMLIRFGDIDVRGIGHFYGQLVFGSNYMVPGDSGSISIADDNTVMGLNFAIFDNGDGCANPIYQANLELTGWRRIPSGLPMPIFRWSGRRGQMKLFGNDPVLEDDFPRPGIHYVCGFVQSNSAPQFDGRVELLGRNYVPNRGAMTVDQYLLLGRNSAPNARRIRNVRRIDDPRYSANANEIVFFTITGFGGFGTVIELCAADDREGWLCLGVSVKVDGRWTIGPPPAMGRDLRSILIATYHDDVDPDMGGGVLVERYLNWAR